MEPVVIGFLKYLNHQVGQYLGIPLLKNLNDLLEPWSDFTSHEFLHNYTRGDENNFFNDFARVLSNKIHRS